MFHVCCKRGRFLPLLHPVHCLQGRSRSLPWVSHHSKVTPCEGERVSFSLPLSLVLFVLQSHINPLWKSSSGIGCLQSCQTQISAMNPWGHFGEHLQDGTLLSLPKSFPIIIPKLPWSYSSPNPLAERTLMHHYCLFHEYVNCRTNQYTLCARRDPRFTYYQTEIIHTPYLY